MQKYNVGWGLTNSCNMNCKFCYSKETRKTTKDATIETGYSLRVPLFIKEGEHIIVSTLDGKYVSRA